MMPRFWSAVSAASLVTLALVLASTFIVIAKQVVHAQQATSQQLGVSLVEMKDGVLVEAQRPQYAPGLELNFQGEGGYTFTLTEVRSDGSLRFDAVFESGRTSWVHYTPELNFIESSKLRISPPRCTFRFPLRVGKRWDCTYTYAKRGESPHEQWLEVHVAGVQSHRLSGSGEEVAVFRIEMKNGRPGRGGYSTGTFFYSPQIGYNVRYRSPRSESWEMTSYTLPPAE